MFKKFKSVVAVFLVVVMLFGTFSITISAATSQSPLSYNILDEYTIGEEKYSRVELSKDYKDVKKGAVFFLDSNGNVVTDKETYTKLIQIQLVLDVSTVAKRGLEETKEVIQYYYDVYSAIHLSEKVGTIAGKGCYLTLNLLNPEPFSMADATVDLVKEVASPDALVYNSILLIYSQNATIYANNALALTDDDLKNYENAMLFVESWDNSYASKNVVFEIAKDDLDEAASTSILKELGKYFKNVFVSFAEEFLGTFKVAKYIYDASTKIVDLGDLVTDLGIVAKYNNYLAEGMTGRLNKDFDMSTVLTIAEYMNVEEEPSEEENVGINSTINERIEQVLATYKPGNSYFTKNGKACSCHTNNSFSCVDSPSACNCLRKVTINGKTVDLLAVQCFGYARYWQQALFGAFEKDTAKFQKLSGVSGSLTANNVKNWFTNNKALLHPGTHIRVYSSSASSGHSIVLLDVDYNNGTVKYIDCNWSGKCAVGKITTITWANFASKFGTLHYGYVYKNYYTEYPTKEVPPIATEFVPTIKEGIYTLKIAHTSGTMLNVYNGVADWKNNPNLTTWKKDGTAEQKFYFKHEADGKYRIYAVCSGANGSVYNKVVDIYIGAKNTDVLNLGDKFDIWDKEAKYDNCQLFYVVPVEDGKYVIELASMPNAVLAAKNATEAAKNGGEIVLQNYESLATQQWYFYNESGTASVDPSVNNALEYTVTYNANGGDGAPTEQIKNHKTDLTLSTKTPVKLGYTFVGWDTSSRATTVKYQSGATYTADADMTLYAVWKANEYTVTYNANGGKNAPAVQIKTHGINLDVSSGVPTRDGYNFLGWAMTSDSTSVIYQPNGIYTANADVTLYAAWEKVGIDNSDVETEKESAIQTDLVVDSTETDDSSTATEKESVADKETVVDSTEVDTSIKVTDKETVADGTEVDKESAENKETVDDGTDADKESAENKETVADGTDADKESAENKETVADGTDADKESAENKETVADGTADTDKESVENKETVADGTDVDTDIVEDKETISDGTESESSNITTESGTESETADSTEKGDSCGSTISLSALLTVGTICTGFVFKKRKDD